MIHLLFGVHALYAEWPAQTCFGDHLLHGRRRETVSDNARREGIHAAVPTATSPLRLRRGYKKRPAVSHDRSLILLMVSDKRTRDVNSRMKIRSCATNDLRLPNEPLKSEFEIGCCKYSLFHSFHQNPNAFFSYTTEENKLFKSLNRGNFAFLSIRRDHQLSSEVIDKE